MQKLSPPFTLIKKSVDLFFKKENFIFLIKIYIPLAVFSVLTVAQSYLPDSIRNSNITLITIVAIVLQFLYIVVGVFVAASGIVAFRKIVEEEKLSVKETFQIAWKRLWKFSVLSLLVFLMTIGGGILLIIPGIIFSVWYVFSRFILIESEKGEVLISLGRSKNLLRGRFWKVFGRLIVFGFFAIIVQVALSVIPFGIGSVALSLCKGLFLLPTYLLYREISE